MNTKIKIYSGATETHPSIFLCEREPMTREEYLKWRAEWKAKYADLSQRIRANKLAIKEAQRSGDNAAHSRLTRTGMILRDYANEALNERRIMKLVAAASYEHFRKEQQLAA